MLLKKSDTGQQEFFLDFFEGVDAHLEVVWVPLRAVRARFPMYLATPSCRRYATGLKTQEIFSTWSLRDFFNGIDPILLYQNQL